MPTPPAIVVPANPLPSLPGLRYAIAQVESGDDSTALGRDGERTKYQFKIDTWAKYSSEPIRDASPAECDRVADLYLLDIMRHLERIKIPVTPRNIYVCWRYGVHTPAIMIKSPHTDADRVQRLFESFTR